jgi:hypothetical protein
MFEISLFFIVVTSKRKGKSVLAASCVYDHSHKVFGSMESRYGVAVRGTLLVTDFYTSGRK